MQLLTRLWADEAGVILSAEAAVVGTVAVVGLSTGLSVVGRSVNEELKDVGIALRSLDQSYQIPAQTGCCAQTAGSCFQQQPVKKSLAELRDVADEADEAERLQQKKNAAPKRKKDSDRKSSPKKEQRQI